MAVYPPRMAPFGLKLWGNAFQTIPDFSFFNAEKKIGEFFGSKKPCFAILARFVRSYGQTDFKIGFGVKFCSRYTFPEVCAIKNDAENEVNTAKIIALNSA